MNAIPAWQGNLREHLSFRPLPLEVAVKLRIEDLRADFWSACNRLHVGIGTSYLPADFPTVDTDEASLLEEGVIDSTGVLELMLFLEEEFGCTITDAEATPRNLDSVGKILAFLARKVPAANVG